MCPFGVTKFYNMLNQPISIYVFQRKMAAAEDSYRLPCFNPRYRVSIEYCVFSLKFCDFSELRGSAAALVFYLPGMCTHADTEGKQRKARVRNILKSSEKNTIFNEHPLYDEH